MSSILSYLGLDPRLGEVIIAGIGETFYMVVISTVAAYILGIPIGVILYITGKGGIRENGIINGILSFIVNVLRAVPFIILIVTLLPVTRAIVHTTIGCNATIVPLVIAAAPFVGRMVESSLKEVDEGVIEAAKAMGSSNWQIISKVLIPEARPSLLVGFTIAFATILGYSAMAGILGAGGLGAIAINYGYYRFQPDVMWVAVVLLVIFVIVFQEGGLRLVNKIDRRIKK